MTLSYEEAVTLSYEEARARMVAYIATTEYAHDTVSDYASGNERFFLFDVDGTGGATDPVLTPAGEPTSWFVIDRKTSRITRVMSDLMFSFGPSDTHSIWELEKKFGNFPPPPPLPEYEDDEIEDEDEIGVLVPIDH
ncbi:hypothetical protein [uncultured Actinomyces sp.]|uniref:hypothetical protein n=1 Tax=uncultured Actinomyces sp. TaxID=249061 RepID=UPI0028E909D3|nr:hypothetical protein [uncultured Actinomyces sp.]